jgi:hypothetical protein
MNRLNTLHSKLHSNLLYAKDETAWGKLSADDLTKNSGIVQRDSTSTVWDVLLPDILDMIVHEAPRETVEMIEQDGEILSRSEIQKVIDAS